MGVEEKMYQSRLKINPPPNTVAVDNDDAAVMIAIRTTTLISPDFDTKYTTSFVPGWNMQDLGTIQSFLGWGCGR